MTLDDLKDHLRRRLLEHDGNIEPHHLVDLVEEAKKIGLAERDIAKLVPEIDQSINWAAIKEEKRAALETKLFKEQADLQATELLDALINSSFSDGIIEQSELAIIYNKAAALEQSELRISKKINNKIKKGGYKPYPNADLTAKGLKELLLSTSWYDADNYAAIVSKAPPANPAPVAPVVNIPIPKIHSFKASKSEIKKGESTTISWDVSGVDHITISGLGRTNRLKGTYDVVLTANCDYVLNAGGLEQKLRITVQQPKNSNLLWQIIFGFITLCIIAKACS